MKMMGERLIVKCPNSFDDNENSEVKQENRKIKKKPFTNQQCFFLETFQKYSVLG
jgi:hypothetical protein